MLFALWTAISDNVKTIQSRLSVVLYIFITINIGNSKQIEAISGPDLD